MATVVLRKQKPKTLPELAVSHWTPPSPEETAIQDDFVATPMDALFNAATGIVNEIGTQAERYSPRIGKNIKSIASMAPILGMMVGNRSVTGQKFQKELGIAHKMHNSGMDMEQIAKTTGWMKLPGASNNEWFRHVPDNIKFSDKVIKPNADGSSDFVDFSLPYKDKSFTKKLHTKDVFTEPTSLDREYPEAAKHTTFRDSIFSLMGGGGIIPGKHKISAGAWRKEDVTGTVAHEFNHLASHIERRATGGNTEEFRSEAVKSAEKLYDKLRGIRDRSSKKLGEMLKPATGRSYGDAHDISYAKENAEFYNKLVKDYDRMIQRHSKIAKPDDTFLGGLIRDRKTYAEKANQYNQVIAIGETPAARRRIMVIEKAKSKMAELEPIKDSPYNNYKKLADEALSRLNASLETNPPPKGQFILDPEFFKARTGSDINDLTYRYRYRD